MPWPVSTKLSGKVVVDRWLRWNFKEPEARNHDAPKDTHWEGCSELWFFSKPLTDAKITNQAWDLGPLQWCPSSVISTKGFKTFLFLNCGKQKGRGFIRASPYFLHWVFSMQVSFRLSFICWILSFHCFLGKRTHIFSTVYQEVFSKLTFGPMALWTRQFDGLFPHFFKSGKGSIWRLNT